MAYEEVLWGGYEEVLLGKEVLLGGYDEVLFSES